MEINELITELKRYPQNLKVYCFDGEDENVDFELVEHPIGVVIQIKGE